MKDQSSLIKDLTIGRDAEPRTRPGYYVSVVIIAGVSVALGIAGASLWQLRPAGEQATAPTPVPDEAPVTRREPSRSTSTLDASGYVVARRQATVSAQITGQLMAVLIEEGQQVEAGQVIARLDDSSANAALAQAEARLAHSRAAADAAAQAFENAKPIYVRHRELYQARAISLHEYQLATADFEAAEAEVFVREQAVSVAEADLALALTNREFTVIKAPFAGIVTVKAAQAGEIVSPISAGGGFTRTGVGTIVDMDSLEVEVDVSENFIQRVRAGQPATVTLNAYPSEPMAAEVIAVVSTADRARATVKVRVGLRGKDARVLPEMGVRVSFLSAPASPDRGTVRNQFEALGTDATSSAMVASDLTDGRKEP